MTTENNQAGITMTTVEDIKGIDRVVEIASLCAPVLVIKKGEGISFPKEALDYMEFRQPHPREKKGTCSFGEADSFVRYALVHATEGTTIWAAPASGGATVRAVFDDHYKERPGWKRHQAKLDLDFSPEWKEWIDATRESMSQEAFADFIDENGMDVISSTGQPTASELMEMARDLRIHTKGTFQKQFVKETGEYSLISKSENESNSTVVPKTFMIGIPVYEGAILDRCTVRLHFRVESSGVRFSMEIDQRARLIRRAFQAIVEDIKEGAPDIPLYIQAKE